MQLKETICPRLQFWKITNIVTFLSCNGKEMPQLQILSVCFASLLLIQAHSLPARVYLQIEPGKRTNSEPLGCLIFLSAVLFFYYVVAR